MPSIMGVSGSSTWYVMGSPPITPVRNRTATATARMLRPIRVHCFLLNSFIAILLHSLRPAP